MSDLPIDPVTGRVLISLDRSLGSVFIGTVIAGILWGITCSQVFHYYTTRPKDSIWIKCMVATTWVFDTTHQALIYVQLYQYCVSNFGDIVYLNSVPKTTPFDLSLISLSAFVVHAFYAYKIWKLSERNMLITAPIIVLCLAEIGIGIVVVYNSATAAFDWEAQLKAGSVMGAVTSAVSTLLDGGITVAMIWLLRRHTSEYVQTKSIVGKLVVFLLSTNLLTAVNALAIFIVYLVFPKDLFIVPLFYLIIRLYANSFMAALNMRPYLRQTHRAAFEETLPGASNQINVLVWQERVTDRLNTATATRLSQHEARSFHGKEDQRMNDIDIIPGTTTIELEEGIGRRLEPNDTKRVLSKN